MKRFLILLFLMILIVNIFSTSLWNSSNNNRFKNLLASRKAQRIGDILTVVVYENPAISSKSSQDAFKKALLGIVSGTVQALTDFDLSKFIPINNNLSIRERAGTLRTSIIMKIAAVVVDVDERGNLVIEGRKRIKIGEDLKEMILKGVVRPEDINADNTVDSSKIANSEIWINGRIVFKSSPDEQESWLELILSTLADLFF